MKTYPKQIFRKTQKKKLEHFSEILFFFFWGGGDFHETFIPKTSKVQERSIFESSRLTYHRTIEELNRLGTAVMCNHPDQTFIRTL